MIHIIYALIMAIFDTLGLSILKMINVGTLTNYFWFIIPVFIYALQPLIFFKALQYESLTIMNILFDLSSVVFISIVGLFVFAKKMDNYKILGIITSAISFYLLS
jgi:multidrug transporter EmrE-like cation transporter